MLVHSNGALVWLNIVNWVDVLDFLFVYPDDANDSFSNFWLNSILQDGPSAIVVNSCVVLAPRWLEFWFDSYPVAVVVRPPKFASMLVSYPHFRDLHPWQFRRVHVHFHTDRVVRCCLLIDGGVVVEYFLEVRMVGKHIDREILLWYTIKVVMY